MFLGKSFPERIRVGLEIPEIWRSDLSCRFQPMSELLGQYLEEVPIHKPRCDIMPLKWCTSYSLVLYPTVTVLRSCWVNLGFLGIKSMGRWLFATILWSRWCLELPWRIKIVYRLACHRSIDIPHLSCSYLLSSLWQLRKNSSEMRHMSKAPFFCPFQPMCFRDRTRKDFSSKHT